MDTHLPLDAPQHDYERWAAEILAAHQTGDAHGTGFFHSYHPRFRDPEVPWKPADLDRCVIAAAPLDMDDALLAVARSYDFRDWAALTDLVAELRRRDSPVRAFEFAVEAVVDGDWAALDEMLRADPSLVHARSSRVTSFDPPGHRATLLHYVAANGVERFRQRTPANAVAIAERLLEAGADPNALARVYAGECATLPLLVSSEHPHRAGVQVALIHTLVDAGAEIDRVGDVTWTSPVHTALVFGYVAAARALVERGAATDSLAVAAGLGRLDDVEARLPTSTSEQRQAALALSAQLGQTAVVARLLTTDVDPTRHNPPGFHAHATPLHHAALRGHLEVVRLLLAHGARLDVADTIWRGTPLGWAVHGDQHEVAEFLRAAGAR
ncbi:MAG: ankyrin repeat domain-containing protein [Planctomycetes bacterium]|nr:ankyrin repeat domain-containing protein [Planctomycetota bacterium]